MLMRTPEEDGLLEVNKQYQEMIKLVVTLVTASLVLPVAFLTNILGVVPIGIKEHLRPWALCGLGVLRNFSRLLLLLLLFSTKFAKAVFKGQLKEPEGVRMENWRDRAAYAAASSFFLGLIFIAKFFLRELL